MIMVRTYGFPGCFTRPTGDLDSQLSPRFVHVEACRPRELCAFKVSFHRPRRPASVGSRKMDYRTLGRTGTRVSPLCLGAMMFGAWGNEDHDDSVRIIHRALDAGINFIDTADVY